jgi:hypothetical protein
VAVRKPPKAIRGVREALRGIKAHAIPVIATSLSTLGHVEIAMQLREQKLLSIIEESNFHGRETAVRSYAAEVGLTPMVEDLINAHDLRMAVLREIQKLYPGHRIVFFNDAPDGFELVRELGGLCVGMASGLGRELHSDRKRLIAGGAHFIMTDWRQWRQLLLRLGITPLTSGPISGAPTAASGSGTKNRPGPAHPRGLKRDLLRAA